MRALCWLGVALAGCAGFPTSAHTASPHGTAPHGLPQASPFAQLASTVSRAGSSAAFQQVALARLRRAKLAANGQLTTPHLNAVAGVRAPPRLARGSSTARAPSGLPAHGSKELKEERWPPDLPSNERTFEAIYAAKSWGAEGNASGPAASLEGARGARHVLTHVLQKCAFPTATNGRPATC